jgi:DNA polymerase
VRERLARLVTELRAAAAAEADAPGGAHAVVPRAEPRVVAAPSAADVIAGIEEAVRACRRCGLGATRTNAVPGEGSPDTPVMFVGEAPGADEDRQGRPFVGRAGELLTKMLAAINIRREEVYIANVLKCRPPRNRDPAPDETAMCRRWLMAQIEAIRPRFIVTLGRVPAQLLLETSTGILKMRGTPRRFDYPGGAATLLPTLHPAYLLRNESAKREAWEDLKLLHRLLREDAAARPAGPGQTGDWPPPLC